MGSTGFLEFKYTSPILVINVQGHHNKLIKLNRPDSLQKNNKRLLLTYIEIKYHKSSHTQQFERFKRCFRIRF